MTLALLGIRADPVRPDDRDDWEMVARASDGSWMGHAWAWAELVEEHVWGGRRASVVLRDGSRVIGIVPLHVTEQRLGPLRRRVLHSERWGAGGIALIPDLTVAQRDAAMVIAAAAIHDTARKLEVDKLLVRFPVLSRRNLECGDDAAALLAAHGLIRDRSTRSLVLRLSGRSEDDLWKGLEGRARTAVRKAEREGVRVQMDDDRERVTERYYALHLATYERTGARPHPRKYFETILQEEWSVVLFAEREGRTIGALNIGTWRGRAVYWTGASLVEAGVTGANNLLQWHAIRWLRETGHSAYELGELPGEAPASAGDAKLLGLATFKRSFGAEALPFVRGERVYRPMREDMIGVARKMRS